jgi:hypothetical protein
MVAYYYKCSLPAQFPMKSVDTAAIDGLGGRKRRNTRPVTPGTCGTGEIAWRDGLNWWERTAQVLDTVREQAVDWTSHRWKSFVDVLNDERDNPDNGPDIER